MLSLSGHVYTLLLALSTNAKIGCRMDRKTENILTSHPDFLFIFPQSVEKWKKKVVHRKKMGVTDHLKE